jgi:Leucine-rich repeat (LRR) protein
MTVELVTMKTKTNRLETIKNLNLWGNDLEDISIVSQMQALEVLSLAVNKVSTLRDIQYCSNLKELYMRKNNLVNLSEVPRYLGGLSRLRKLSLSENPMAETNPKYRLYVIKALPLLENLDTLPVTQEERVKVEYLSLDELLNDNGGVSPSRAPPRVQAKPSFTAEEVKGTLADLCRSRNSHLLLLVVAESSGRRLDSS